LLVESDPAIGGEDQKLEYFDVWAWHVIEALKRESVRSPSERLDSLIAELESLAPDRPRAQGPDYLGFSVPPCALRAA
jgi:hypothetical protein